ncbi:MAG TPA: hypothetical protein VN822_11455 [Candidatus Acidoferrales bacterium]|nr:hypothetical protein [Candidatus Acidoferrales bacterium]
MRRAQADATLYEASNAIGNIAPATSRATSLWEGYVDVVFFKFSGETDPGFLVNNSWSIQANTNNFAGKNGDFDWVQFVFTNIPPDPEGELPSLCVMQEDITLGISPNANQNQCVNAPVQTLSSNFAGYVSGITSVSLVCKEVPFFHWPYACAPTYNLTAIFTAWNGGEVVGASWAVTAPDIFGLSTRWNEISGTIVGTSQRTQAQFTSPTLIVSNTGAYRPGLNNVSFSNNRPPTSETNNLTFKSESTYCVSTGWCYLITSLGN